MKLRCRPVAIPCSLAMCAARSESSINTIALTEEIAPCKQQSRMLSVVTRSRPQSSAFMIRRPVCVVTVAGRDATSPTSYLCASLYRSSAMAQPAADWQNVQAAYAPCSSTFASCAGDHRPHLRSCDSGRSCACRTDQETVRLVHCYRTDRL